MMKIWLVGSLVWTLLTWLFYRSVKNGPTDDFGSGILVLMMAGLTLLDWVMFGLVLAYRHGQL